MNVRIRKAGPTSSSLYEMNFGGKQWYFINRSNMEITGPLRQQCNLFNALLAGLIASVKGRYFRKEKKLKLEL